MAVSDLEAKIRSEAFRDVPKRIEALTARLDIVESAGSCNHDLVDKELLYLERVISAMPQRAAARKMYQDEVAALRIRATASEARTPANPTTSKRKKVGDFLAECDVCSPGAEQLRDPSKLHRLKSQRSGLAYPRSKPKVKDDSLSWRSGGTPTPNSKQSYSSDGPEGQIANFLMPDLPQGEGDDVVRLLAVQKELTPMLGRCQTLMVPEQDKTLLIRAWIEDDNQQEQVAFMELSKGAAILREVAQQVAQTVEDGQEALDQVMAETEKSKEATNQAVESVTNAAKAKFWLCNLIGPVIGLAIILVGAFWAKLTSHSMVIFPIVGVIVGGVLFFISRKFINWRGRTMKAIEKDVARVDAWAPLAPHVAGEIRSAGIAAQVRLAELIGGTWMQERVVRGWQVESATSRGKAQSNLHAFKIQLEAKVSARVAFNELERLRIEGKLDPRCKAMWSRPVDVDGTHIRYSSHSFLLKNREFLTVCRSSKVQNADPSLEAYICAAASLSEDLTALVEPEKPAQVVHRGLVHLVGASIRDVDTDACHVEVLTDIDPQLFGCLGMSTLFSERTARYHVYLIASELQRSLSKQAEGSMASLSISMRND